MSIVLKKKLAPTIAQPLQNRLDILCRGIEIAQVEVQVLHMN